MKKLNIVIMILLGVSVYASADTKSLNCTQTTNEGFDQIINATLDDDSDKAEVQLYSVDTTCIADQSCKTEVYKKEVLPSVIRLTSSTFLPGLSYITIIDINRDNLSVVTRTSLKTKQGNAETNARGYCKVKVHKTENLL